MKTTNMVKTTLLLGGLTGLFLLIGSAIGGTGGMIFAFVLAIALNMGAWWFSDKLALRMSGAKEASPEEAPDLHRMVEELSARANLPKPRVYIIETDMPNAFATGRSPQNSAVAATTGIMNMLTYDELAGVMAHELAHIKNRDTLISSVAATIGGAITMIADLAMWALIFGGFGGDEEEGGGLGEAVGGIFMLILAPIASIIIQMAISRAREYDADADGARILGNAMPLADALEKLEGWSHSRQQAHEQGEMVPGDEQRVNPAISHLYIIPPLAGGLASLFRTHPETEKRVAKLRSMVIESELPRVA